MADGHFPTLVSATRDSNSASNPMFIRLTDGTDLANIDASGNLNVVVGNGAGASAVNIQDGGNSITIDDGGSSITVDGTVTVTATDLDIRDLTSVSDSVEVLQNTHDDLNANANIQVGDTDVSPSNPVPISKNGSANSSSNPIFVNIVTGGVSASEVQDYDTSASVASDTADNHDYTVTATKTFLLKSIIVSSSGGSKFELKVGPVATLVTKAVGFIAKEGGVSQLEFNPPIEVPDTLTGTIRLIRTNRQGAAQDLYSTIIGDEV